MFICASYKFLKFRMLINSNAKFNVKCCFPTILAVFSTWSCRSTSLPFLLVKKKMFTIEEKIKLLDANKKTRQSCRQLADQFRIGRPQLPKLLTILTWTNWCFTEFSTKTHWNTRLAASDIFICLHNQLSSLIPLSYRCLKNVIH